MRYRLLIFDFDGTLADTFPSFLKHMEQVVDHFGLRRIDAEGLDQLRACSAREIMARLGLPVWKVPMVAKYFRKLMAADVGEMRLFAQVPEVLQALVASGVRLAIVSSNAEANVRAVLGDKLASQVDVFECGAALFGKAARFRKVLRRTRTVASEAIAIGDEIRDMEAANDVGIAFGAVSWGYTKIEALQSRDPAWVFDQPQDLEKLGRLPTSAGSS